MQEVSVPLSGLSFLIMTSGSLLGWLVGGFRPLIGVIISNPTNNPAGSGQPTDWFPSPYRGYHF